MSPETRDKLAKMLRTDIEFYRYINKRLDKQLREIKDKNQ